ncbi:Engulfment and cell motility protein 1, partial [Stegodyphus mimosarum]
MPAIKDINIVKIAVEMEDQVPQLIEFDQKRPLAAIIQDLCTTWGLTDADQYALQFSDNAHNYITEKNRNDIKNGSVLRLTYSSTKTAQEILEKLNFGTQDEKKTALRRLARLSADYTFALEFINKQGSNFLISMIEGGNYTGELMALTLQSFVELMDHGIVSWDNLQDKFIGRVANQVNSQTSTQDCRSLQASLAILESLVLNSSGKYPLVEQEVTLPYLIVHLQSPIPEIQQNAIALINALFLKADINKRKAVAATLTSKQIRNVIMVHIIQKQHVGAEMAHQLYVLQTLLFNLLEEKMKRKLDPQDPEAREKILELRRIAFDTDAEIVNSAGRKG